MDKLAAKRINVPVIPGIMPVTSLEQLEKITGSFGPKSPEELRGMLRACTSQAELSARAVEFSVKQCAGLKDSGVKGFHFYTLNRAASVTDIINGAGLN
jgi:methylenetetrahydrofolate reductase (NADPH)